ncbi:MAG: hypothetical protein ACJ74O_06120 [Frankiaceae bacterium]
MSNNRKRRQGSGKRERRIVVRGVRRDPPDLRKLSRALIALAQVQAEKDAQNEHQQGQAANHEGRDGH